MKKVLLSLLVAVTGLVSAQNDQAGFEQGEGFFPGDITGQDGWFATPVGTSYAIGQEVTAAFSSTGDQSLKLGYVEDYGYLGQEYGYILGANKQYETLFPLQNGLTIQWDFMTTAADQSEMSDFVMYANGPAVDNPEQVIRSQGYNFSYSGFIRNIQYNENGSSGPNYYWTDMQLGSWVPNTWYTAKMVYNGVQWEYYLNNALIGSFDTFGNVSGINYIQFVTDNYQYDGYVDNYLITTSLSVNDLAAERGVSTLYPNPARAHVTVKLSENFNAANTKATLTNVSGKQVGSFENINNINVSHLPAGVYILTLTDGKQTETKKLIKK
ncbi:MAG: T9SS type A sorting domain-containing protein [Flavobacteriaceae bacterium]|nr:T9SS type A sorting domain-containing protein [Flavobacteriaceae bacterium]